MLRGTSELFGLDLIATDGEVGDVEDLYIDSVDGQVRYLLADTGTWLVEHEIILAAECISEVDFEDKKIHVELTKEQIESSPKRQSGQPISRQHEQDLAAHYGWMPYWDPMAVNLGQGVNLPGDTRGRFRRRPDQAPAGGPAEDSRTREAHRQRQGEMLYSARKLLKAKLEGADQKLGRVEELYIDDENLQAALLAIETGGWLSQQRRLLPMECIETWDPVDGKLLVGVNSKTLEQAPQPGDDRISRQAEQAACDAVGVRPRWET
jgi:sporulation protein YlmC with PRC-barrel domain